MGGRACDDVSRFLSLFLFFSSLLSISADFSAIPGVGVRDAPHWRPGKFCQLPERRRAWLVAPTAFGGVNTPNTVTPSCRSEVMNMESGSRMSPVDPTGGARRHQSRSARLVGSPPGQGHGSAAGVRGATNALGTQKALVNLLGVGFRVCPGSPREVTFELRET